MSNLSDGVVVHWPITRPERFLAPNGQPCWSMDVLATVGGDYDKYQLVFDSEEKANYLARQFYDSVADVFMDDLDARWLEEKQQQQQELGQ